MSRITRHFWFIWIFFMALTAGGQTGKAFPPKPADSVRRISPKSFKDLKNAFLSNSEEFASYDLTYQRMEWEADPGVRYIKGKITSHLKLTTSVASKIYFDLDDALRVDSVIRRGKKLTFSRSNDRLIIDLPSPAESGSLDSLSVFYQGQPAQSGFGSFVVALHQMTPVLWTLSEPYGAMEWWPCKQTLTDKIDSIDVIVATPGQYRTASNGILMSEREMGDRRVMHWRHRYPIATYLVAIAITNYVDYADTLRFDDGRTMPVVHFVYPESLDYAKSRTPVTLELIEHFNQLFGLYPFSREKYGHAQFGWGGGMEHQTMSFMTNFEFELVAHELAHSWFGNAITLASWHDIWLNEGFATFATGLAWEALMGKEKGRNWLKSNHSNVIGLDGGTVYVSDTTNVNRIFNGRLSYAKGGYLLRMLRWKMGDELFFKAVRNYFADQSLLYGFSSHQRLVAHLEAAAGESLTEFFNDWYYGEGYPYYSAVFESLPGNRFTVRLSQRSSHISVPFFEMPVPVRAYSTGRRDSADFRLDQQYNNQLFELTAPFQVAELVIDPDLWLIRRIESVTVAAPVSQQERISVYPNPFSDGFNLVIPQGIKVQKAEMYNQAGTLVWQHAGDPRQRICPVVTRGAYLLKITADDGVYRNTIIKLPSNEPAR